MSNEGREIGRAATGQTKRGSSEEGTNASHVLSYEVLNTVLDQHPGRPFSEGTKSDIRREMNADENLRIKTREGNLSGSEATPYAGFLCFSSAMSEGQASLGFLRVMQRRQIL